jgi:hypothetical protein
VETITVVVIVGVIVLDWFRVTFKDDESTVEFILEYSQDDEDKTGVGAILLLDSEIIEDDTNGSVGEVVKV